MPGLRSLSQRGRTKFFSSFFQELDAQHEALDLVVAAINFVFIVGEANGRNLGPALQRLVPAPFTFKSLIRMTESPSFSTVPLLSFTSMGLTSF